MPDNGLRVGQRVRTAQHGTGFIKEIDHRRATVLLDSGNEIILSLESGQIDRAPFEVGSRVVDSNGNEGIVQKTLESERRPQCQVAWFNGTTTTVAEMALRPAELSDPIERFKAGKIERPDQFNLRSTVADLWIRNRSGDYISLAHARFDLMPHQVGVLHRVMTSSPHRFLLSDEVGLGKTIEAGMILKELRSRGLCERVLVLAPANLQNQWQYELKTKFNETFAIFNRTTLNALQERNGDANPWTSRSYNLVITSHQFAAYSEERRKQIASAGWDLIIVDEAHHARRQRKGQRIEQTNLYRLVRDLTSGKGLDRRAALFLTATPMQLQHHELFSLVELLDYSLFASEHDFNRHLQSRAELTRLIAEIEEKRPDGTDLANYYEHYRNSALFRGDWDGDSSSPKDYDELIGLLRSSHKLNEVMLRTRRASIPGGFMPRIASQWEVHLTPQEELAQKEMQAIIREGYQRAQRLQAREASAIGFVMVIFERLAASSSQALRMSLERRKQRLLSGDIADSAMWIEDEEIENILVADDDTDSLLEGTDFANNASMHVGSAIEHEAERLQKVIELLNQIEIDSKAVVLRNQLRILRTQEPNAKVVIFTEFLETQRMLRNLLNEDNWHCEVFHGQLTATQKDDAITDFRNAQGAAVLISTEAGGEGRNIQFANVLVNYDLPWNPMKVEQRIGRLDRIGQQKEVLIFNLRIHGTVEERILDVLEHRIGLFKDAVGGLGPILGEIEQDIRKAMRQGDEERLAAIDRIGDSVAKEIEGIRRAEEQLGELYADNRAYQRRMNELIGKMEERAVDQHIIDALMQRLIEAAGGTVTSAGDGRRFRKGQRRVVFSARFATEASDLFPPYELEFDACFDSNLLVDSAHIEYLGFGHPIIERLVRCTIERSHAGKATIRRLSRESISQIRPGWQFNWRLTLDGATQRDWLIPIFVSDDLQRDDEIAHSLLKHSQLFREVTPTNAGGALTQTETLDDAYRIADEIIQDISQEFEDEHREKAHADYSEAKSRIERLYEVRIAGAEEKLRSDSEIRRRIRESGDPVQQQALPIWDANVRRGEDLLRRLPLERDRDLEALARSREPNISRQLLNMARIEVEHSQS